MNEERCAVRAPRLSAEDMVAEQSKMLLELESCLKEITFALDGGERTEGCSKSEIQAGLLDRICDNGKTLKLCLDRAQALIGMISG